MYAARPSNMRKRRSRISLACTGPISYTGQERVQADIRNLQEAMQAVDASQGFITALSPTNVAPHYRNEHYRTEEEYLAAIADAMHEEYAAIVEAGFILQIDDPRLATLYDRNPRLVDRRLPQGHRRQRRTPQSRAARLTPGSRAFPHLL